MKYFKGFILGCITSLVILLSFQSYAEGFWKTISVAVNSITLKVNDEKVWVDNFVYNGTTYVPLRAVSEMLNKNVDWDDRTRTVNISDNYSSYSYQNNRNALKPDLVFSDPSVYVNVYGVPELKFKAVNYSDKDIISFEFRCKFLNIYDRPVYRIGSVDPYYYGIAPYTSLKSAKTLYSSSPTSAFEREFTFDLDSFNSAYKLDTSDCDNFTGNAIQLTRVEYADGTVWIGY